MKFANVRKGKVEGEVKDKPKQEFEQSSVKNFRQKMMEEEMKEELELKKPENKDPTRQISVN